MKKILTKNDYYKLVDKLFTQIEKNIDRHQGKSDIDCELHHNMITISFQNGSKIIINRQESLHQIWLATKITGYHFIYDNNKWICNRTHENFWDILKKTFLNQANERIKFSDNI